MAHYARGIAFAALGEVQAAEEEEALFLGLLDNPAIHDRVMNVNNSMWHPGKPSTLRVAKSMLAGEIAYRRGRYAAAFHHLREVWLWPALTPRLFGPSARCTTTSRGAG